ncbi:hypothetical protein [Desulfosporosinus sp. FKA]|uniref:hypothetical protein n=1 Tax=Desulfosporosinus sp. FKA TaxID=1969834 RepID=UPI000B4A1B3D|nr:hypothetical protein [Desulfosporosinus sp. FKA]
MIRSKFLDLKLNYYALTIAILGECNIETAFEKVQSDHPEMVHPQFSMDDLEDMRKLKAEGVSWPELGRIYNVPWTTVYGRIRPRNRKEA